MAQQDVRWDDTRRGIEFQLLLWAEDPQGWELVNTEEPRMWLLEGDKS